MKLIGKTLEHGNAIIEITVNELNMIEGGLQQYSLKMKEMGLKYAEDKYISLYREALHFEMQIR